MPLPWSVASSPGRTTSNLCAGWAEGWVPWSLISPHQSSSQCFSPILCTLTAARVTVKWVTPSTYSLYTIIWFPLWLLILRVAWIQLSPFLLAPHINNHPQTAPAAFHPHLSPISTTKISSTAMFFVYSLLMVLWPKRISKFAHALWRHGCSCWDRQANQDSEIPYDADEN